MIKNLDIRIIPKEQQFWERIKQKVEAEIDAIEGSLKINRELLKVADLKIKEESKNGK